MTKRAYILIGLLLLAFSVLFPLRAIYMSNEAIKNACHTIDAAKWPSILSSYDRGPITDPAAPFVDVTFTLDFPFSVGGDDILLLGAYSESRKIEHRLYDGRLPEDRRVVIRLGVAGDVALEQYWLSIDLIRPEQMMTCNWTMEERFELPYPNGAQQWRLELLPAPIETDDGGSRFTRLSPIEFSEQ